MGNEVGRSNTHVANATGRDIRVFYHTDRMVAEEIVTDMHSDSGITVSKSALEASLQTGMSIKATYRRDTRIRSFHIPPHDFNKIAGEGEIYLSVFFEHDEDKGEFICHNYHIPSDRSVIVTANRSIKFQKYGSSLWEDEYGNRYR